MPTEIQKAALPLTPGQYRQQAKLCRAEAESLTDIDARQKLIWDAELWDHLADVFEERVPDDAGSKPYRAPRGR